jgi:hypothetical protein
MLRKVGFVIWTRKLVRSKSATLILGLGLTRFHGQIKVKRSGSVKGVKDGQNEEALPS